MPRTCRVPIEVGGHAIGVVGLLAQLIQQPEAPVARRPLLLRHQLHSQGAFRFSALGAQQKRCLFTSDWAMQRSAWQVRKQQGTTLSTSCRLSGARCESALAHGHCLLKHDMPRVLLRP